MTAKSHRLKIVQAKHFKVNRIMRSAGYTWIPTNRAISPEFLADYWKLGDTVYSQDEVYHLLDTIGMLKVNLLDRVRMKLKGRL